MSKITVLVGISDIVKSNLAREIAKETGANIVIRDGIRSMLFGLSDQDHTAYYQDPQLWSKEKLVSTVEISTIKSLLKSGGSVISDNTHLKLDYVTGYKKYGVPVEYQLVDEDLFTCMTRDSAWVRSVGNDVLKYQYDNLLKLKENFDFKPYTPNISPKKERDPEKKDCMIYDLDGTLALMKGRSPFDWHRVGEDGLNHPIYEIYQGMAFSKGIMETDQIIVSGRSEESMELTKEWLKRYEIQYEGIYMRKKGDNRKDSIVKEEIWNEIEKEYNIICMFDDRDQVVEHARSLGYTVAQVAEGNF